MKNLLKYVPGFRSNNKRNIVIASIYYAICIYNFPTLNYLPYAIIMIVIPFIFFYIKDVMKKEHLKHVQLFKSSSEGKEPINEPVVKTPVQLTKLVTISIIVCITIFFSFGTYMRTIENAKIKVENARIAKSNAIQVEKNIINKAKVELEAKQKEEAAVTAETAKYTADEAKKAAAATAEAAKETANEAKETAEESKYAASIAAGQQIAKDVNIAATAQAATKDPTIGMTADQVRGSAWGSPDSINKTITQNDKNEQWVYGDNKYVYLDNGIVTEIQQ